MREPAVVVTGASTGIGRACAIHLDERGFRVLAGVRRERDAEALRDIGSSRMQPLLLDVTRSEQVAEMARIAAEATRDSGLAGVVNNAGIAVAGPVEFTELEEWRRQFEVNVFGHVAVTRALLPLLRESRGRIVFMSSLGGRLSQPFVAPYSASKFAIEAIGDALRIELRPWGIRVALVEPGAVATPIWAKGLDAATVALDGAPRAMRSLYGEAITVVMELSRRMGESGVAPEKVAAAVVHALTASRPKTRYLVGRDARIGSLVAELLPGRLRDAALVRIMGLNRIGAAEVDHEPSRAEQLATV